MKIPDWLGRPIANAINNQGDQLRADLKSDVKAELDELRAELPDIVRAAAEGGTQAVINAVLHPFGHAAHLDPMENAPIPPDEHQAQPLNDDQRANLEKLRDRYAPDRKRATLGELRHQTGQNAE